MSETINLTATNASLALSGSSPLPVLTSGMQNHVLCHFAFGAAWSNLSRVAVFRAGDKHRSISREYWLDDSTVAVPPEILSASGYRVHVGLYGYSGTPDNIIIPTVEFCIGRVQIGADPSGDAPADETRPLWLQIQQSLGEISALLTEDKGSAIAAINELASKIGDLNDLDTQQKQTLVDAINEAFRHSNITSVNGKTGEVVLCGNDIQVGLQTEEDPLSLNAALDVLLYKLWLTERKIPSGASTENMLVDTDALNRKFDEGIHYINCTADYERLLAENAELTPENYFMRLTGQGFPEKGSGLHFVRSAAYGDFYVRLFNPRNGYASLEITRYDTQYGHQYKLLYWLKDASWDLVKRETCSEDGIIFLNENDGEGTLIKNVMYPGDANDAANKKYVDSRTLIFTVTLLHNAWEAVEVEEDEDPLFTQTVSVPELHDIRSNENANLTICPHPNNVAAWTNYGMLCTGVTEGNREADGTLTVISKTRPATNENITLNITLMR